MGDFDDLRARQQDMESYAATFNNGRKPVFGCLVRNPWAGQDNPTREGLFVRERRITGRLNPGRYYELTDGKGKFWEISAKTALLIDPATEGRNPPA